MRTELLTFFSIAPEINGLGQYCGVIWTKFNISTTYFDNKLHAHVSFHLGIRILDFSILPKKF